MSFVPILIQLVFILINLIFAVVIFYLTIAFLTGAPYVPSTNVVAKQMTTLANIQPDERVIDLGSGDGKLLRLAAKKGAYAIGYEINPFLVFVSNLLSLTVKQRANITTKLGNFWHADIANADVIFVYLLPWKMDKLEEKLKTGLKPGARIVSNSFMFKALKLTASDEKNHIFVYTV